MATLTFLTGSPANFPINNLSGSGLGFYGSTFGNSVQVGAFQTTTWVTDSNGTIQGPQCNNVTWTHPSSGSINGAASVALNKIPNYLCPLNIRFTNATAVVTQNSKLRIYDRSNINNDPSGVLCKVAQVAHDSFSQSVNGSGDTSWSTPTGSSVILAIAFDNPQTSGGRYNGATGSDTQHDYYFALSSSPNSIGSKTFALYFQLEYL